MFKKIGNLFNVKAWLESFVAKMVLEKGVKHAVTAVVGLLGSAVFLTKVQPVLTQLGIDIDPKELAAGLTVFFGGAAGWLINWAQKTMGKNDPATTPAA